MNPNVNPVYGYNCYNIADNQFLMGNKSPAEMNVGTPPKGNHINYVGTNQNKEILWKNGVGDQQVRRKGKPRSSCICSEAECKYAQVISQPHYVCRGVDSVAYDYKACGAGRTWF